MNVRSVVLIVGCFVASTGCVGQQRTVTADVCGDPKLATPAPVYQPQHVDNQPAGTVDLPTVVQTVEQALKCYQALSGQSDPLQPKGLPKISSAVMDFKTTTGKTIGFSFSIFVFKVGASREKDVTDDVSFTYSPPKQVALPKGPGLARATPASFYEELVKEVQAASSSAQAQSTALGLPLSKVSITVAYGIKFDGNIALNVPIHLVTIGGNGDYNKNNTQTVTLTFGQ
jgi:hypothetical protein